MPTYVSDPQPVEVASLIERRRRLGQDLLDEMWDGVLHMNPAPDIGHGKLETQLARLLGPLVDAAGLTMSGQFNLGDEDDFRVPDGGLHRGNPSGVWLATAAVVMEIVSPGDETYAKLSFYAAHEVGELLIVDQPGREVKWLGLTAGRYQPLTASGLIDLGPDELAQRIDWP